MADTDKDNPIADLQKQQNDYWPNNDVIQDLGERSLVMLVSPAGVGKSAIIRELARHDARFAQVSDITTREPRGDDEPGLFRYVAEGSPGFDKLVQDITERNLVQYQVHPSTGKIYGTEIADYPGHYNCLAVLGDTATKMRTLPFLRHHTFSLVCDPEQWRARFNKRYPNADDPEHAKRLEEAKMNLEWSLQDKETVWIRNNDGELDDACRRIMEYTTGTAEPDAAEQDQLRQLARDMLAQIKR